MAPRARRLPGGRRSKYRAIRTTVDEIAFASKAEARRYRELLLLGLAGEIRNLELQPRFPITVNGQTVATYVADFRYQEIEPWQRGLEWEWKDVVEDVKSPMTRKLPTYRLKKKLVEAQHGIVIREVR